MILLKLQTSMKEASLEVLKRCRKSYEISQILYRPAANREAARAVIPAELNLVGLAMRAERKVIDKIVDGLKLHS
jgi:hypothetical protein